MDTSPEQLSLAAWLDRWIGVYAPLRCRSLKTIERYHSLARYLYRTPELRAAGETDLSALTHTTLETALLSLLRLRGRERLSARSVRHAASLMRVALNKAFVLGLIATNPMLKVELPGFEPGRASALDAADVKALRNACKCDWTALFVDLALATGCRRGELLALEWTDIDFGNRNISISKSLEQTKAGLRLKTTKGGRPRVFSLPKAVTEALRQHRKDNPQARLLFAGQNGKHLRPDPVSKVIVRRMRNAGIGGSLHTLRHTHATLLLSMGIPLTVISKRLGHADPNITARVYCHLIPADDQRAADEWDRFLADCG